MSLIQDALKRQLEESESNQVPPKVAPAQPPAVQLRRANNTGEIATVGRPAPSVPDTMPIPLRPPATTGSPIDAPVTPCVVLRAGPEKPVQPGKSWKRIAGIIIFCVIIGWSGGLLVVLILKQSAARSLLVPFIPDLTHGRATLGKSPVQAPPPATQPPVAAVSKPVVTPSPAYLSAPTPIPWISPAAAAAPAFGDEREDDEEAALPSVNKQELPVTAPSPVPVVWPRLKLSAVFSKVGSGQAGARLNNRLILLGDQIDGVTLVEIRQDSVVLKCGTEVRILKMGMTLN